MWPVRPQRAGGESAETHGETLKPDVILSRGERPINLRLAGRLTEPERGRSRSPLHLRRAAVLVPIIERESGATVLFTRRADHLRDHAGQISFPGGREEPGDSNALDTALREANEEIGLARDVVTPIGCLDDCPTSTRFLVTPVVGLVPPGEELRLDYGEVAAAFEVPLSVLLDRDRYRRGTIHRGGAAVVYHSIEYGGYLIWGATVTMLLDLVSRL